MSFERTSRKHHDKSLKHASERVADTQRRATAQGRITRSGKLPTPRPSTETPIHSEQQAPSQPPPSHDSGLIEDWTDVALRPDLYQGPVLRGSLAEIGTMAPPYHGPIQRKTPDVGSSHTAEDEHESVRTLHVTEGETLRLSAGSSASAVTIQVFDPSGRMVATTKGKTANLLFVAAQSGRHRVVLESSTEGPVGVGPVGGASGHRLMIARERGATQPGEENGASPLTRRQHLLLNVFGINPTALTSETELQMGQSLDKLELIARIAATSKDGDALPATLGTVQLRTEHSSGSVETAVYELTDGTSQLLLQTRYDSASGTLVASLDFRADDGTAVHGTLTHNAGLADGIPVSPSQNPIAEYLAADPGEFGAIDDFSDATGNSRSSGSEEGIGSFFEGAIAGDLSDNNSWSAVGGQTAMGFVPIAGQIADIRDIGASIGNVGSGKPGAWIGLGIAVVAIIPGLDFLKGGSKAGRKALAEAAEEGMSATAKSGLKRAGKVISKEAAARATRELTNLAVARRELLVRWQLLLADDGLSVGARANLRTARNTLHDHLKPDDLAGALRDKLGLPVRKSGSGVEWDHLGEVNDGLKSLVNARRAVLRDLHRLTPGSAQHKMLSEAADEMAETQRRIKSFLEIQ
ncbi:MAG: polymorphic toxin type 28 domain-containing protein [Proteobacteria bacterium]|nr:polymorphic toxin type 28 domain-containing protein [Pseudomonadota bacterium]